LSRYFVASVCSILCTKMAADKGSWNERYVHFMYSGGGRQGLLKTNICTFYVQKWRPTGAPETKDMYILCTKMVANRGSWSQRYVHSMYINGAQQGLLKPKICTLYVAYKDEDDSAPEPKDMYILQWCNEPFVITRFLSTKEYVRLPTKWSKFV